MSDLAIFNVNPAAVVVKAESPLAMSRVTVQTVGSAKEAGVVVREHAFLGHLVLRGNAADAAFCGGVEQVLGLPLPQGMGLLSMDTERGVSIQWMSPDEWLVIVPAGREHETEMRLRTALTGHFAVMIVSGGQTVLELSGRAVREVLMKSMAYDVHPSQFPVGKGVSTTFAKASAIVRRVGEERWELVIRRSFADYLYRWVLDASEEFGVFVASR
ncbi:sarcosine oxidase subunit gamma [Azoarcus sp. KH32C]|uniref:sarcosine oxidase subunit gamma n=1 Tax=Azoarcus sp. KH32C TaxID=748247 RepID=UPI0002385D88|nr:sarcosine oxidase subunit gamma family protein [Azoarcus sp. KH32C]BAL27064.1 sarcosine oxidase gamma subunit family protein [Azoarcus sp. KH32C]